jgi:cytochrome c551/c552
MFTMKNSMLILVAAIALACIAASGPSYTSVADALREQNKQLARIAASLERIAGQQPGWKLPK